MRINRICEHQNLPSLLLVSFLVGLRTYQHPCNNTLFVRFSMTYFNLCLMMAFIYAETCSRTDNKMFLRSCLSNLSRKLATIRL
jgi:hypothetical protein